MPREITYKDDFQLFLIVYKRKDAYSKISKIIVCNSICKSITSGRGKLGRGSIGQTGLRLQI